MRFRKSLVSAVLLGMALVLSGCAWLPAYMKAKAAINERYAGKEEQIERRYALGQISDATYDRQYEELYRQWDEELTIAKARAQGLKVASSRGSSSKRRASSNRPASSQESSRFDTYTAEYVGGSSSSESPGSSPAPAQPPQ